MTSDGDAMYALEEIKKQLIGGTITGGIVSAGENPDSYGFRVEKDGKTFACWVDCDPEGNGPGFLQIEETDDVLPG